MSINIMSLVFKAKIENVEMGEKIVTAPLLKLILLALADHCNDDGDGAYPSLLTLEKKTALTHQSVLNSIKALKQRGLIIRAGISKRGTTNYSLNVHMLKSLVFQTDTPLFSGSEPISEVPASKPGGLPPVNLVDCPSKPGGLEPSFNRPLTILKESSEFSKTENSSTELIYENTDEEGNEIPPLKKKKKPPLEKNLIWRYMESIADVTGMSVYSNRGKLSKAAKNVMLDPRASPELIRSVFGPGGDWYKKDWQARKNQKPTPFQVVEKLFTYGEVHTDEYTEFNAAEFLAEQRRK